MAIDLWADGIQVTLEKMAAKTGTDISELMTYTSPAAGLLSRDLDTRSDLHTEWNATVAENPIDIEDPFSLADTLAPRMFGSETGPAQTRNPFERHGDDTTMPGMFGQALTSFGNAVAVMKACEVDTAEYHKYFANDWDLRPIVEATRDIDGVFLEDLEGEDEDDDHYDYESIEILKRSIPTLRSTGDAMWAGISANLSPYCAALPATRPLVTIKQHGTTRKTLGSRKLADWNHVSEVAIAMTVQAVADDFHAQGKPGRLDFSIDTREVPVAPANIMLLEIGVKEFGNKERSFDVRAIASYLSQSHKLDQSWRGELDGRTIIVEEPEILDALEVGLALRKFGRERLSVPETTNFGTQDLSQPRKNRLKLPIVAFDMSPEDLLNYYAQTCVRNKKYADVREWTVKDVLGKLNSPNEETRIDARERGRKLVNVAFPDVFLKSALTLWNYSRSDSTMSLQVGLVRFLKLKPGIMQDHSLISWWVQFKSDTNVLEKLLDIVARAIEIENRFRAGSIVDFGIKFSIDVMDPIAPLDAAFSERKRYWASRYRANAKCGEELRVLYQVMASVFKTLKFRIDSVGNVNVIYDNAAKKLCTTAYRFICKRVRTVLIEVPEYSWTDIGLGKLDRFVAQIVEDEMDISFKSIYDAVLIRANSFKMDVIKIVRLALKRGRIVNSGEHFEEAETHPVAMRGTKSHGKPNSIKRHERKTKFESKARASKAVRSKLARFDITDLSSEEDSSSDDDVRYGVKLAPVVLETYVAQTTDTMNFLNIDSAPAQKPEGRLKDDTEEAEDIAKSGEVTTDSATEVNTFSFDGFCETGPVLVLLRQELEEDLPTLTHADLYEILKDNPKTVSLQVYRTILEAATVLVNDRLRKKARTPNTKENLEGPDISEI